MPSRRPIEPRTVDAQCYCLNAQRAARRLARLYDDGLRPFGLSHGQFSLLMVIAGHQPVSVGQVAATLVMDRTTATAALKPLERRELVEAVPSPADRRQRLLTLTPSGLSLLASASTAWQGLQKTVQSHEPPDTLRADLRRLATTASSSPRRLTARGTPGDPT